eukprot:g6484.t1
MWKEFEKIVDSSTQLIGSIWNALSKKKTKKRKRQRDVVPKDSSSVIKKEVKKRKIVTVTHAKVSPPVVKSTKYSNIPAIFRPKAKVRKEERLEPLPVPDFVPPYYPPPQQHVPYVPYYPPPLLPIPQQRPFFTSPPPPPPMYYGSPFEPLRENSSTSYYDSTGRDYRTPISRRTRSTSMKSPMQRAFETDYNIASRSLVSQTSPSRDRDGEDAIRDLRVSTTRSILESWGKYDNEIMAERRRLVDVTRQIVDDDADYNNNNNNNDDDDDDKAEKMDDDKEEDDDFEFLSELQTTMAREKENTVVATSDEDTTSFSFAQRGKTIPGEDDDDDDEEEDDEMIWFQDLPFRPNEIDIARFAFDESKDDSEELAQIGKQYVTRKKIRCLADGEWLNDEVINFMMETHQREGVCVFNSFLYSMLMQNDVYDYKRVRRWTKRRKIDVFKFEKLLVPINLPGHWSLVEINMSRKEFIYLDSMNRHGRSGSDVIENLKRWLNDESMDKRKIQVEDIEDWEVHIRTDVPQQNNTFDCGVYATKFAEYSSLGENPSFGPADIPRFRAEYVLKIMSYSEK